jgi:hypothetical protein
LDEKYCAAAAKKQTIGSIHLGDWQVKSVGKCSETFACSGTNRNINGYFMTK